MTTGGGAPGERASSGAGDDLTHLLRRVAARDAAAFAALYKQTSAKLYGVVARILTRSDVAADVLQEVYVRVWEKAGEFDPVKGSAVAWMATIARNRALDEVRRVRPASLRTNRRASNRPRTRWIRSPSVNAPKGSQGLSTAFRDWTRRNARSFC